MVSAKPEDSAGNKKRMLNYQVISFSVPLSKRIDACWQAD
jgi:hypothetical protein